MRKEGRRRIFVDFTLVDYRTRVTGIPRVAYAYLEEGYALGDAYGLEVVPVYIQDGELIDARPFLVGEFLERRQAVEIALGDRVVRLKLFGARVCLVCLAVAAQLRERLAEPVVRLDRTRVEPQQFVVDGQRLGPVALLGGVQRTLGQRPALLADAVAR